MSTSESAVNGNISKCQLAYIDKIKQQIADSSSAIPLCYNPDNYAPRGVPKLEETFWLKPVYVMDPEKQFVGLKIKCSKCDKHLSLLLMDGVPTIVMFSSLFKYVSLSFAKK